MITYVDGDLFQSPAKVLVNTVNTVGVMGLGIALQFKKIYPDMFKTYQILCERKQFDIGQLWLYKTPNKWILNFPTKKHWKQKSRPEYIEKGLQKFVSTYDEKGITSISFPLLGCGNGELDWETQVRPLMEKYLRDLPITIFIHLYKVDKIVPEHYDSEAIHAWLQSEPQTLAFDEFWEDLSKVIKTKRHFKTLDNQKEFNVKVDTKRDGIAIQLDAEEPIFIPREEHGLLDLWEYVRTATYAAPDKLPMGLDAYGSYLVSLLASLKYITPVQLSRPDGGQEQIGLQLTPKLDKETDNAKMAPSVVTPIWE